MNAETVKASAVTPPDVASPASEIIPTRELAPVSRPPQTLGQGMIPRTIDEAWRLADGLSGSGMVPKDMANKPKAVFAAIILGAELGLPPMSACQNICVINGRPTLWGDAMLGVVQRSGQFDASAFKEGYVGAAGKDDFAAFTELRRVGSNNTVRVEFSIADAKKAGLWGKSGPWTQHPKRMLKYRARSFALRDTFADVLKGLYTVEEMRDVRPAFEAPTGWRDEEPPPPKSLADVAKEAAQQLAAPALPPPVREQPAPKPTPAPQPKAHGPTSRDKLLKLYEAIEDKEAADASLASCGIEDLSQPGGLTVATLKQATEDLERIRIEEASERAKGKEQAAKGAAGKQGKLI